MGCYVSVIKFWRKASIEMKPVNAPGVYFICLVLMSCVFGYDEKLIRGNYSLDVV
tara:strand:- start:4562 stop:4726 length:165 start_codon:yes stop_codon:yes gene_type:complete